MTDPVQLMKNSTASQSYPTANGVSYPGPVQMYEVTGAFDGASVQVQSLAPGHTEWRNVGEPFTAAGAILLRISRGSAIRDTVASAGASTSLTSTLLPYDGGE